MFWIKKLLFDRWLSNILVSFNIKGGISLILCDRLPNVLLATLKSLQFDFFFVLLQIENNGCLEARKSIQLNIVIRRKYCSPLYSYFISHHQVDMCKNYSLCSLLALCSRSLLGKFLIKRDADWQMFVCFCLLKINRYNFLWVQLPFICVASVLSLGSWFII